MSREANSKDSKHVRSPNMTAPNTKVSAASASKQLHNHVHKKREIGEGKNRTEIIRAVICTQGGQVQEA